MPPIYWAIWRDDLDSTGDSTAFSAPWTMNADTECGKRPPVVILVKPMFNFSAFYAFGNYSAAFATIHAHGQIPFLNWAATIWNGSVSPAPTIQNITAGNWDTDIQTFALALKALDYSVFVLLSEEVNLNGNPWSDPTGVDYIAFYKHVVDIFDANGVKNVSFVWNVNGVPSGNLPPLSQWWPGNKANGTPYVHWATMDVFNSAGANVATFLTFDQMMDGDPFGNWGNSWDQLIALDTTGQVRYGLMSWASDDRQKTGTIDYPAKVAIMTTAYGTEIPHQAGSSRDYSKLEFVGWFDPNEPRASAPDGETHWNLLSFPIGTDAQAQAAYQGPNGPGGSAFYLAGAQFVLPSGQTRVFQPSGIVQDEAFTRAVLNTNPSHLKWYVKHNESAGNAIDSIGGRNGTYSGTFTLNQPKIIPGTYFDGTAKLDGITGFVTFADDPIFSLVTTQQMTIMVVASLAAISGTQALISKVGAAGTQFEYALRVLATGAVEGIHWNLGGSNYSDAATGGGIVAANVPVLCIWTLNQARTPVGRLAITPLSGATTFVNSVDTLANAPANGTAALNVGRRGNPDQFANAFVSHAAIWDVALSDLSATELAKAMALRNDFPMVF